MARSITDMIWICEDCGQKITHTNNKMIILKDEIFLSIAKEEESPCDACLEKRLGRRIEISDLWVSPYGYVSFLNDWYIKIIRPDNQHVT
jgi:hypothetical protein